MQASGRADGDLSLAILLELCAIEKQVVLCNRLEDVPREWQDYCPLLREDFEALLQVARDHGVAAVRRVIDVMEVFRSPTGEWPRVARVLEERPLLPMGDEPPGWS